MSSAFDIPCPASRSAEAPRPPGICEVTREFRFEAAHSLARDVDAERSARIHGHSYRAEVTVRGALDAVTGMLIDFAHLDRALEAARIGLDHRLLDEVDDLGPSTMENLAVWIWRRVADACPEICRVTVRRDSDQSSCSLCAPAA